MDNYSGTATHSATAGRVIPLLEALNRAEETTSSMVMRLDPITNHVPHPESSLKDSPPQTVTARISALADALQYLLDNIEL